MYIGISHSCLDGNNQQRVLRDNMIVIHLFILGFFITKVFSLRNPLFSTAAVPDYVQVECAA